MKPLAAILFLLAPGILFLLAPGILLAHAQRTSSSRDTDPAQGGGNPRSTRGSRKFGTEQQQEASRDSSTVKDNQESSRGQEVVRVARRPGSRDRGYTQANFQEPDTASSVIAPVTHQLLSRSFSQRRSFADAREEDLVETAPRARTSFDSREIADKPLRRRIPSSVKPDATDDNTKGRSDVNTAAGEDVQRIRGGRRKSSTHAPEASADNVGRSPPRRSRTTTISPAQEQPTSGFEGARRRSSPKDTALTSPSDATPRRRGPANEGNNVVPQEIGSRVTSSTGGSQEINKNSRRKPSRTSAPTTSDDASPLRSRGGARRQSSTQETVGRSSRTGSGRQTATTTTTTTSTTTTSSPPVAVTVKDVEELQVTVSSEPEGTAGTRDHIPVVETVDDLPANTGPASIVDAFSTTSKVNGPNSGKPRESVGGSVDVSKIGRNAAGPRNASPSSNDRRKKTFSRSTTAEQASESQSVESSTAAIFSRRKSLRNQATDRDENIPASRKQTPRNWRTTHSPLDQDEPISASAVPETANLISFPAEVVSTTRGPEVVPNELNAIPELVQTVNAEQGFRRLRVPLRKDQTDASGDAGSQEIVRTRPSSRSNAASGKRDSENTPVRSETVPKFNRRPSWTRPSTSDDANLSPTSSNRDRTTESSVADVMSGRRKVAAEPSRRGVDPQISKGRPKDPFKFEPRRPGRLSSSANAYRTSHEQVEMRPEAGVTLEETQPMEVQETRDILKNVRYTEQIEPSRSPQSDLEESFITRSSQQVVTITVLPETTSAIQAPVNSLFSSRSPDFPTRFANLRNKYRASLDAEAKASSGTRTRKYQKPGSDAAPATESSRQIPATLAGRPDHGPRHRFSPGAAERPLFSAGYRKSSSPPSPLEEDASRPSSTPSRSTSGIRRSVPVTPPSDVSTTSSSVGVPRFSARYKSDLLRAATGLRATTTPVYLPTVPTVRPNTSTTTEGTSITTSSVDLLIVASTIGADTATTRMVTEETTIADFDDEILGANSDNEETSEESPATTEAPSAMTTLPPPPPPPPSTTAEPLGETTTTTTTESPPTTAMAPVSETTTPIATTTTTEETITTSTPTPVLEGSPSGDEPVTSSPPSSTDPPITTESTATTTTEPTTTTTTEPTTTTTEPTTTTTTTTEPITSTTTTTTELTTTTTTTTEPTTSTTTTTTEPTTTTTTTTTEPTATTTTETTTTSAPYSTTPASRFVSRMAVAPIGTPSSTPATNLFDDFNSVYQTAQRREDTDEGSSSLLLISSLRNRLTTPRAERRISDQENDINYQPPAGTSSNSFTSFNLGPSPPLFASSRASLDFPGYNPTQSPYYSTPPRPPRTPVPYVIFGIFPNNTVFRKFPNSNVKEIVSENEIANRQPYYPEQRGNDYDIYRPTAGYSEGRNFSPFVSSVTVTPSTTQRAVPGLSEIDEEEENHLLLFLSVNRGASSSTEQSEVDVRIGEPSTVVFTSTETPSSIGEPSSLVLVSTEPPSSTTTEPSTTTTTTEPSTTTTTTEPSTTTTTTEPSTTTTTTEPSTTTTTTEPSTTTTTTEPSTTTTTTEPSTTTTTEPSTTTTTTEPSTTTTTTEPSTTTTTSEPSTTTTTEPSTTTTTTEPSTTATSTATVFVVTPAQSDDKPLGAPKSPDSSGKESVPGGKNPPGSLPDISGLGNSLQVQTRSSSPRPTGNQDSPSALANRIIEMALQRQKAATPSQLVGSASTPRSVMVSTAGAENELLRLLGQSAGRLPQSPTALKGTSPDSTALLALLQNTNKDASKSSQHLLASFSGRQPTQSELLNKINLGEVLSLAAQMKPSSSPGTATPQGGLRQVFSTGGGSSGSAQGLVDVAINMTRAMSTLMGQVIQGAAQSLQSFVRERTGNLAKYFNFGSG